MPRITLEISDDVLVRLTERARRHGRSLEEEARLALQRHYASREAIIDRAQTRAAKYKPVTAEELQQWRAEGRP